MTKPDFFYKYNPKEDVTRCPYGMSPIRTELNEYVIAALNLYNLIDINEMVELYNNYTRRDMTPELLYQLLLPLVFKEEYYFFYKDLIVGIGYLDYEEGIINLHEHQQNFERYIPDTKDEFLKYLYYYNDNPCEKDIYNFFYKATDEDELGTNILTLRAMDCIERSANIDEALELLNSRPVVKELTDELLNAFLDVYTNAYNHQRRALTKGNRPVDVPIKDNFKPSKPKKGPVYKQSRTAHFSRRDGELFFELWHTLLFYVNVRTEIFPIDVFFQHLQDDYGYTLLVEVRDALWERPAYILELIDQHDIKGQKRKIYESWYEHHVKGLFSVVEHQKNHTLFIGSKEDGEESVYGVRGLTRPLGEILTYIPTPVRTVLLPFKNYIVYDTFLSQISGIEYTDRAKKTFGESIENTLKNTKVITRLG